MSRRLTCEICGRLQAVGIMSGQAWETVNGGARTVHACPECQAKHHDWREQLTRLLATSG